MTSLTTRIRTYAAIGVGNGLRVLFYRLALKYRVHPVQHIAVSVPTGRFFVPPNGEPVAAPVPEHWQAMAPMFGLPAVVLGAGPPVWTVDPIEGAARPATQPDKMASWWEIGDFAGGDIKRIWEFSRFDWVISFAQQARNGDVAALDRLDDWLADWITKNPPYLGPNWKCAQEASIRLLHLAVAALILGNEKLVSDPLRALIIAHVRRIEPTLSYAAAQDNNHATSEAAALFIAGAWLGLSGNPLAAALIDRGRGLLERHTARLFDEDGSFSQYSMNYHRVALDTLSLVEIWRRRANLAPFSTLFLDRAGAASDWLRIMVAPETGDAPNLGANDGANILPLTDAVYRDHRPSVQLATALFRNARAYPSGPWDQALTWLAQEQKSEVLPLPPLTVMDGGGFAVLRRGDAMAMLRYPRFRFRPGQADALHLDLWQAGQNLLRDAGSYSYNTEKRWIDYFGGVESHNTVQFDGEPQMPRLSRFLLGDWLSTSERGVVESVDGPAFRASYRHRRGWTHAREVRLGERLKVTDRVGGFAKSAVLRWRLSPGEWRVEGESITDGVHRLSVTADVPIDDFQVTAGYESRYYSQMTTLPVLEVTISRAGKLTSLFGGIS